MKSGWLSLATNVHDETVALKVIRMTSDVNPGVLRRFKHEYGLLSALENVNVVRVLKWGLEEDFVYIALEHCAGGDLNERIGRGISTEDAVDYLVQIMRGLKALHARGILHRDLKPSNLLFREDGTLVLTDFGIERDLCDDPRFTSTRSLLGDLSYVSPESIRHWTVDLRSDLYSAGIVFYHMLTGTVPFKSTAVTTMLEAHLKAPIPRLPRSAAALQPLIDGLLEKNPNDRFQSAADVLDGIEWLTPASA
jgi:serine/threonine-protein kinase PpkA